MKISKKDYDRKFKERTKLMMKKKQLRDDRLSKKQHNIVFATSSRQSNKNAPFAHMVRKQTLETS